LVVGEIFERGVEVVGNPDAPLRDAKFPATRWNMGQVDCTLTLPVPDVDENVLAA
jgi:hypothetical protein